MRDTNDKSENERLTVCWKCKEFTSGEVVQEGRIKREPQARTSVTRCEVCDEGLFDRDRYAIIERSNGTDSSQKSNEDDSCE